MSKLIAKKVTVRRFGNENLDAYVDPHRYLREDGIEVTTLDARMVTVPYRQVRAVYFVREFGLDPERDQRLEFASRPKLAGLWVRMLFRKGGHLEGIMPNDLQIMGAPGLTVTPPDSNRHNRTVFVPSDALERVVVIGVIGRSPYQRRRRPRVPKRDPGLRPLFSQA